MAFLLDLTPYKLYLIENRLIITIRFLSYKKFKVSYKIV
jgi:hypothetical protein